MSFTKKIIKKFLYVLGLYPWMVVLEKRIGYFNPVAKTNQKEMLNFYSQFIKNGDLCFDIGANVGDITETFLKLGARVIAVEPQKICLKILYRLFRKNKNLVIVNKAVGEESGISELSISEEAHSISTMSNKWKKEGRFSQNYKWTKNQKVMVVTLDDLIKEYGLPKFCKIDVEGFEVSVLKGLTRSISYISFEFTREFFDDAKKCIDYLFSLGQAEFNYSIGESPKLFSSTWLKSEELYLKLENINDKYLWGNIYVKFS